MNIVNKLSYNLFNGCSNAIINLITAESTSVDLTSLDAWHFIIQISILFVAILLGNVISKKISMVERSLLPAPLIGGLLLMIFMNLPFTSNIIDTDFMTLITIHAVGLGFVAITLKKAVNQKKKDDKETLMIMKSAFIMTNVHLVQAICGLLITIIFALLGFSLIYSAGLLAPIGLAQGTGLATSIGQMFQDPYIGQIFASGIDFAISIVAIGFFIACIGGVIALNIYRKKGIFAPKDEKAMLHANIIEKPTKDEIGLTEGVDKFTIQFGIVFFVYFIGYLIMLGLTTLIPVNMVGGLIFGLNFVFGVIAAVLFKIVMSKLGQKGLVKKDYTNNFLLNRTSGILFDLMIVSGFTLVEFRNLSRLWLPLILLCLLAGAATFFYLKVVCKKVFGQYHNEALFAMFGKLTGTTGAGMLLLREVDPKLDTPISRIIALQSLPGMVLLFPLILLIPMAMISFVMALVVMGILVVMFIIFHILIYVTGKSKVK